VSVRRWLCGCALPFLACAAADNPSRAGLRPAPAQDPAQDPAPAARPAEEPAEAQPVEAASPQGSDAAQGLVATVAGRPVGVRDLLARLWLRDGERARELLDHLVIERLCELEAERLGLAIRAATVDERVARAEETLRKRLRDAGSPLGLDEHVQKVLGLEPDFYRRQLRHEAISQVLAERCVRVWAMEEARRCVRVFEAEGEALARQIEQELAAGADFAALAAHAKAEKPAQLVLARAEASPLARLAFATEVGRCAGPLAEEGRYLFLSVDSELPPLRGEWSAIGAAVEASLAETPVAEVEFMQWRAAMARRYPVDLSPFFAAIGTTRPAGP
jgi:hypothetical protein